VNDGPWHAVNSAVNLNDGHWHAVNSAVNLNDGKNVICKMYLSLLSFLKIHHYKSFQPLLYNNLHYLTNVYIEKIDKKNGYIMYIDYLIFNFKKMKEKKYYLLLINIINRYKFNFNKKYVI